MSGMTVDQLWRFPVKSMGGTRVPELRVDRRGAHADRLWAVRDVEKGITASARRLPVLLGCAARYEAEPAPDAGPGNVPRVIISMPDGRELPSDDPSVHDALSDLAGREMRLTALPRLGDTSQHRMSAQDSLATFSPPMVRQDFGLGADEALPDTSMFIARQIATLARYSTPPGTFVDLSPVHLMTTASLRDLSVNPTPYDVRRFRPNVLVRVEDVDQQFPESAWVNGEVELGTAALRVTNPTIRCVVPTRSQPDLEPDRAITRQLASRTNRCLGVYADVRTPGVVREGDDVRVHLATPPGLLRVAAIAANRAAIRGAQRVFEATILRSRG